MQSLAFLWFDLQMTQRYLSEITFGLGQSQIESVITKRFHTIALFYSNRFFMLVNKVK
jgi:hypothetical protein